MPLLKPSLPEGEVFGVLAQFASPKDLYHACERVRDAGYSRWDAHSPFAVHGLDRAMGLGRSRLPWVTLLFGLTGATGGFCLQAWGNGLAYHMKISGKPVFDFVTTFDGWQPYVPITFECGVLLAAISTVVGMLAFNQLPMHFHPLFNSRAFERVTDDAFFISIESWDPKFNVSETERFLKEAGATHVEVVRRSGRDADEVGRAA